ncbi:transposase [Oceanicola sp. D3]|uniref:REP-associated tyrosine transposase n=1 Tax=Oceanicola sp. D3 TaxID=2587163 RepID=UPI0011231465|nr:transposase [Oceanicola sp. D3]QDC08452.1 transposase [Oceanicola sp. D3]
MQRNIRPQLAAAPVFFTVCLAERGTTLLIDGLAVLRDAVRHVKSYRPFDILAFVALPDHLHCVLAFPEDDPNYSQRWGSIKARFSREARKAGLVPPWPTADAEAQRGLFRKGETGLWQKRFREHHCRDEADLQNHVRYCWNDPVKHGLVERPQDWAASSFHREVRAGKVGASWQGRGANSARCGQAA